MMHRFFLVTFGGVFIYGALLLSQTRVRPESLGASALAASAPYRVYAALPNGSIVLADLGAGLILDLTGARPTLRAAGLAPIVEKTVILQPTAPVSSTVLPDNPINGSVHVARNGLLLSSGLDYTVGTDGRTITFVDLPQPGDILQCRYRTQ